MKTLNLNSKVIENSKNNISNADETSSKNTPIKGDTGKHIENQAEKQEVSPLTKPESKSSSVNILKYPRMVFGKFSKMPFFAKAGITLLVCSFIIAIGILVFFNYLFDERDDSSIKIPPFITAEKSKTHQYQSAIPFDVPGEPRTTPNPINGELFTEKEFAEIKSRYPLAVVIENQVQARPQSGYNSADIVFETLAEGGITRTIAVFWGKSVKEIGPIRSLRVYFIEWTAPFDPVVMHIGYALSDDPRIDVARQKINGTFRSLDRGGTFWRNSNRVAPHNAYSSTSLLYEKARVYGYSGSPKEIESWLFKADASPEERGDTTEATIAFFERLNNGGLYNITWRYDPEQNSYLRYNNDTPYVDANTNTTVTAKNIIIQRLSVVSAYDEKAHMIVTTIGTGDAIILRDGQAIYGTWRKESTGKRTRYYDSDGAEIVFNRGTIWVEAVPTDLGSVEILPK